MASLVSGVPPGRAQPASSSSSMLGGGAVTLEALELAGRSVEKMLHSDSQFPPLVDKLRIGEIRSKGPKWSSLTPVSSLSPGAHPSLSGLQEPDYPSLGTSPSSSSSGAPGLGPSSASAVSNAPEAASLRQMSTVRRVPLPAELVEHFGHMQSNCMMGVFPSVGRAWLTIDSDLYVWRFEDCSDLAYFDGLADTILSVGLVTPKRDIFQPHIRYLLCLTTAVEIVLLGVSFGGAGERQEEMHLLPEPLFTLPTDSTYMVTVAGSAATGRVFLGGRDGCLYEFAYKAEDGWFGKKASKVNHSTSALSCLVPSFVNAALYEEDSLEQVVVDDSRGVLYTRSEKGVVQVFDLGADGMGMNKVAAITQANIVQDALKVAR